MSGYRYSDTVQLPDEMTLGVAESIECVLREQCDVVRTAKAITFVATFDEIDVDPEDDFPATRRGDLWDVCEFAYEIAQQLQSHGISYYPSRDRIEEL